jgi:hypothetical protein
MSEIPPPKTAEELWKTKKEKSKTPRGNNQ